MNQKNRCAKCGCLFRPNPRVKDQEYCNRSACQRARKRRWQRKRMATDPDYRANQNGGKKTAKKGGTLRPESTVK